MTQNPNKHKINGIFALVGLLMAKFGSQVIASHQAAMNFSYLAYAFPMSISNAIDDYCIL